MQSVVSVKFIESRGQTISLSKDKVGIVNIVLANTLVDSCKIHLPGCDFLSLVFKKSASSFTLVSSVFVNRFSPVIVTHAG